MLRQRPLKCGTVGPSRHPQPHTPWHRVHEGDRRDSRAGLAARR